MTQLLRRFTLGVVIGIVLALLSSCTRVYYDRSQATTTSTNPTAPTPTPTVTSDKIEFRVFGSGLGPVLIRYTNALDGLTVLSAASLPYIATVRSDQASIFLYAEASAVSSVSTGSLQVQVFVNGILFREGSAAGLGTLLATASGTFRQ